MRQLPTPRRAFPFALAVLATLAAGGFCAGVGCGPDQTMVWFCLNPDSGKLNDAPYDANHNDDAGVFDPCHCYDPCGPAKTCPITVDAGPPPLGCDAGDGGP
jgi:hypothetical protein